MKNLKTGTTTVAIVAKDCIVLGADKRATAGHFIAGKKVDKIQQIASNMAITTAGSVSDIQLLTKIIRAEIKLRALRVGRPMKVSEVANQVASLVYGNIRRFSAIPGVVHFLLGGFDESKNLYDIYPDGSITEIDDFVASGSGSTFAFGVLDAQYKKDLSQQEAVDLVLKAINSALQRDSASGDGLDIAVINKDGYKKVMTKDLRVKV